MILQMTQNRISFTSDYEPGSQVLGRFREQSHMFVKVDILNFVKISTKYQNQ